MDIFNIQFDYSNTVHDKPQALAELEMKELISAIRKSIENSADGSQTKKMKKRKRKSVELCELEELKKKIFDTPKNHKSKPSPRRLFTPLLNDEINEAFVNPKKIVEIYNL